MIKLYPQLSFIICNVFLFSVQLGEGQYTRCLDTCEQGGRQRSVSVPQTNARAQIHSDQEACPQICEMSVTKCNAANVAGSQIHHNVCMFVFLFVWYK